MFPMTVTVSNIAQLNAVMAALAIPAEAPVAPAAKPVKAEKAAKTEPAQATVANNGASSTPENTSASAEAAAQQPAPEAAATAPAAESVSYEDVKNAIVKLSGAKGRDAVVALLQKFGVAKGPDLKPEQYAKFIAAASA